MRTIANTGLFSALTAAVLFSFPVAAAAAPAIHVTTTRSAKPAPLDYLRDVRPILAANCFTCHGQDEKKRQAGLRLDIPAGAYAAGAAGRPAVVPHRPESSTLFRRITAASALRMPPEGSGKRLTAGEIATLRRWVAEGGRYAPHWAFVPPARPALPSVQHSAWPLGAIDRFVVARLEKEGLTPAPDADRYALLRRLSLDLIGLPPTPAEMDAFVNDRSATGYEKAVDRLLASPHFGEKWARMWLDIARYADSAGYGSDPLRPNLWPYRDWVINAFNSNLPYDRFVIDQLAGDLLPAPTDEQRIATAFHRNTMTNTEGGTDREEFRTAAVKDRTITTAQAFMGLTMGCAQCHSHKYDPITQRDFYQFMAFFNQTQDNDQPDESPTAPLLPELQKQNLARYRSEMATLSAGPRTPEIAAKIADLQKRIDAIKPENVPVLVELPAQATRKSYMLTLGNFLLKTDEVRPAVPASFGALPSTAPLNRLSLARWIVAPENPLTARVAVNRIWAQLFGSGLVLTEEDFGLQGSLPSHPELLDWLATDFIDHGMDVKRTIRQIVLSRTYRQSSRANRIGLEKDARNRLLWRYPRRRLTGETVRDQALALSGLLTDKLGGPSVFPPQPDGLWQAAFNGQRSYPTSTGEDRYRRGIYTFWRRTTPNPSMATFDAPSREICTVRRFHTNTPLQALVTLNDPAYIEMAQAMGRRLLREGGGDDGARVRYGLKLVLGRPADPEQAAALTALLSSEVARYRRDPNAARRMATEPLGPAPNGADVAELAAWTVVSNVLLNLDGVLTVN